MSFKFTGFCKKKFAIAIYSAYDVDDTRVVERHLEFEVVSLPVRTVFLFWFSYRTEHFPLNDENLGFRRCGVDIQGGMEVKIGLPHRKKVKLLI
jgi:hypothetical protein